MDRLEYLSCPSSSLSKEGERRWAKQLDNLSYEKRRRRSRDRKSLQDPASPWLSSHTIAQDQSSLPHPVPSTPPLGSPPGSSKHLQTTRADRPEGRATMAMSYLPTRNPGGSTTPVCSPPSTEPGTQSEFSGCLLIKTWGQDAGQPCSLGWGGPAVCEESYPCGQAL